MEELLENLLISIIFSTFSFYEFSFFDNPNKINNTDMSKIFHDWLVFAISLTIPKRNSHVQVYFFYDI